jgi:hypothetical protein
MKIRIAGLKYVIGGHLHIHILPWRGVSMSLIFPLFCWLRLKRCISLFKTEQEPRAVLEARVIGGFVEGQHEIKRPAWSGKKAVGLLASPLDRHKTAQMMPYEDAS